MSVISLPVSGMSASSATVRTRLRITRRGRIVLAALVSLLVLGVVVFGALFGAAQAQIKEEHAAQDEQFQKGKDNDQREKRSDIHTLTFSKLPTSGEGEARGSSSSVCPGNSSGPM